MPCHFSCLPHKCGNKASSHRSSHFNPPSAMRATMLPLACCVLAVLAAASAARVAPDLRSIAQGHEAAAGAHSSTLQDWIAANARDAGKRSQRAFVAFRFLVDPDERDDFVAAWQELEKATAQEKGNLIYDLKQPLTNNMELIGYGEWKSFEDFMAHYRSDAARSFLDKLMKHDVAFTIEPLLKPDVGELTPSKEQEDEKQQAHVLIRYTVPPSATDEFLATWDEARKGTAKEKGVHIYSLRKVWWDNRRFYAYGTWDSLADYRDHFKSDHVRQLRESLDKQGVLWSLSPLRKMGSQPE